MTSPTTDAERVIELRVRIKPRNALSPEQLREEVQKQLFLGFYEEWGQRTCWFDFEYESDVEVDLVSPTARSETP